MLNRACKSRQDSTTKDMSDILTDTNARCGQTEHSKQKGVYPAIRKDTNDYSYRPVQTPKGVSRDPL